MIVSFIAIVVLLIILTFVWPPDSPWSPWWRTNKRTARSACRLARLSKKDIVYELGSGDGEFILTAAKEFDVKRAMGVEIDYSRHLVAVIRKRMLGVENAEFVRDDFKKTNLSDATVIYFYLVPAVIKRILPKLKKELVPGTKVISLKYELPLPLVEKKGNLYLYKI